MGQLDTWQGLIRILFDWAEGYGIALVLQEKIISLKYVCASLTCNVSEIRHTNEH